MDLLVIRKATTDKEKEEYHRTCYDPGPLPQFSTILFCTFGHSSLTRSLTRRSDRHQIT